MSKDKEIKFIQVIEKGDLSEKLQEIERRLDRLENKDTGYLNRKEAAEYLRIHPNTLDNWREKELVNPIKIEGRTLYKKTDLDNIKTQND